MDGNEDDVETVHGRVRDGGCAGGDPWQSAVLRQDTLEPWDEFQATGLHATADEVDKWLASWGTGNELSAPECYK